MSQHPTSFEGVFQKLSIVERVVIGGISKIQRLILGWPPILLGFLAAVVMGSFSSSLFKAIPAAFNYALCQQHSNAAAGFFHAILATFFWGGIITVFLATHWVAVRRFHDCHSVTRPFSNVVFGAMGGFVSSAMLVSVLVFVCHPDSIIDLGWTSHRRDKDYWAFLDDVFFGSRMFAPYMILGIALGAGLALVANGVIASEGWKRVLATQSQLSVQDVAPLLGKVMILIFRNSAPLILAMCLAMILSYLVATQSPVNHSLGFPNWIVTWEDALFGGMTGHHAPEDAGRVREWKISRFGIALGVFFDGLTQMIGGVFCVAGFLVVAIISRAGIQVDPMDDH